MTHHPNPCEPDNRRMGLRPVPKPQDGSETHPAANRILGVVVDFCRLTRPGIVAMVLVTMSVAAFLSNPAQPHWAQLVHALVGAALVISGAIALNQRIERTSDARMVRTALRPLPSGRLTSGQVTAFGAATTGAGVVYLVLFAPPAVWLLTAASWTVYVWMYTPLKARSAWQTPLGAAAGAMPTLIGAAAAGATPLGLMPLILFGIVFFWQFPHAMAIAWLYRADFAAARLKVASVVDPSGRTAARLSLIGAAALLPVSVAPCLDGRVGWRYAAAALAFGLGYLACAAAFARHAVDARARLLLWGSLAYLPAICAALVFAIW